MSSKRTASSTRRTTSTKDTRKTDNLTTKSRSKLTIHDTDPLVKQSSKLGPSPPVIDDQRTSCMRSVNLSLQNLSGAVQSGWKFTPGEGAIRNGRNVDVCASKVDDATKNAKNALERLRELTPDDLDVERAACSIAGKLISLELYEDAIQFLDAMYPRLLRIVGSVRPSGECPPPLHLLALPYPTSDDPTLFTLLATTVAHALNAILFLLLRPSPPFSASTLVATLRQSHPLLSWAPHMKRDIPEKTRDALLTKAYTFINKGCTALSFSSSSTSDAVPIFQLRVYALSCLLYTTAGSIKPATFWDQVHKACLACARTLSSEPMLEERESAVASCISSSLSEVVTLAQSLHEHTFSNGRSFVQMCETWMAFARKGDVSILDRISELMGIPGPSSPRSNLDVDVPTSSLAPLSSSYSVDSLVAKVGKLKISESTTRMSPEPMSHKGTKDDVLVECSQCCAIFVKATTSLDNEGPELARYAKDAVDAVRRYNELISKLDSFMPLSLDGNPILSPVPDASTIDREVARARGKLERALERMRRAGLRALDGTQVLNKDSKRATAMLLEAIAATLEDSLRQQCACAEQKTETKSVLTSFVDVLFALARFRLNPADVDTYTPSLHYLERAVAGVNAASSGTITNDDTATFLRCISGTFHNLGGTLYTADRVGGAVRFLKEGCILASQALTMYGTTCGERVGESDREKEGRKQLEEQLFRRYELLGVCHSKIGDRKLAYECFIESVRTFPYTYHLSRFSSTEPFAPNAPSSLQQLSSIIERLTYAATCELFLPSAQIALRHVFCVSGADANQSPTLELLSTFPSDSQSRAEIAGAILARQLVTLEGIGHKSGVREAITCVLEDLLLVYSADWAPVQRARVLVMCLSASWRVGPTEGSDLSAQLDVDKTGQEALGLLTREISAGSDSHANLVPQLKLAVHMWLALHAYRRSSVGTEMMNAVAAHIESAFNVLCGLLPPKMTTQASPKGKPATGRKVNNGASIKGRSRAGGKKATINVVKSQPRKALGAVSLNTAEPTPCASPGVKKATTPFDQPVLGLIQMNVHLLGLLGLIVLKVKLLEVLKRICEHYMPIPAEAYSVICVELAHEYVKLGKSKRASALFNKCAIVLEGGEVPNEVRLQYLLGHAEVLALGDNVPASTNSYCDAQRLEATVSVEEKTMSTTKRIRMRVERLERAALACRVFAAVQYSQDNVIGALCSMLQSVRLWNRAVDALSRLSPPTNGASKPTEDISNPFEVSTQPNGDQPPSAVPSRSRSTPIDALSWRLLSHLVSTLFSLAQAYHIRGSPREALYFVQQVIDLAESTRALAMAARACLLRGEIFLGQGMLNEGREALEQAGSLLGGMLGIDAADAQRLEGDYKALCGQAGAKEGRDPVEHYDRAWKMLDELERRIGPLDGGRRKSSLDPLPIRAVVNGGQGMIVPRLLSAILRRHIWLLRNDGDGVFRDLVDRLMALPHSTETKGEEHAIMAKLTLHSVYEQFRSDIFLSSLTESTIALPMGMLGDKESAPAPATQDILGALNDAERLFWADLALMSRRGAVPHVREASVSLAMIRTLQSSLGKVSTDAPLLAARLLDVSSAITLHREMLEAIRYKIADASVDDLQWPDMATDDSPLASNTRRRNLSGNSLSSLDSDDDNAQKSYWLALEKKYTSLVLSPSGLLEAPSKLPRHWTVIHITLTPDKSSMFISRLHTPSSQPLLFCIPLRGRRDTDDDDESRLMLEDALYELQEIVRLSDEGTRRAAHVRSNDLQARAGWWAERAALDKRLQSLLENIEFCWLGAFKTILSSPTTLPSEVISDLRTRLERVFKRSLPSQDKKKRKLRLDDELLACFSSLSPKCRDEELEDLVYFILDLYQLHGVPVSISEVDMDQVIVDLRNALEEHAAARKRAKVTPVEDSHTFLVLDRSLQSIPWESLPVLRGQSVSRIPSLEFLHDRIQLAEMQRQGSGQDGGNLIDRIHVDARKAYYVLNPSGDLKGTENRFSSWLKEMHRVGWDGIVGRVPSEQEFLNALSRRDLVIYFGHGGGEQYARSHKIRHLSRCAATMLWGCSSGALRGMGEYDRVGTPYNYMVAGCPTLVANLWDVTDRDIDKFTQAVFDELHLQPERVREQGVGKETSVVAAVARSREVCKLKYLTGAAPVVYGIPFYL